MIRGGFIAGCGAGMGEATGGTEAGALAAEGIPRTRVG